MDVTIPQPVRLVMGVLWCEEQFLDPVQGALEQRFGPVLKKSDIHDFSSMSDYYDREMGGKVRRMFWHFEQSVPRGSLPDVKLACNALERKFSGPHGRRVNLDPGHLTLESLVMATAKGYAHRVYLGKGVYGELTYRFDRRSGYEPLPWTYRDYRMSRARAFFREARAQLMTDTEKR